MLRTSLLYTGIVLFLCLSTICMAKREKVSNLKQPAKRSHLSEHSIKRRQTPSRTTLPPDATKGPQDNDPTVTSPPSAAQNDILEAMKEIAPEIADAITPTLTYIDQLAYNPGYTPDSQLLYDSITAIPSYFNSIVAQSQDPLITDVADKAAKLIDVIAEAVRDPKTEDPSTFAAATMDYLKAFIPYAKSQPCYI